MRRHNLLILSLAFVLICERLFSLQDCFIVPKDLYVGRVEGKGIGYHGGYTTLGFLFMKDFETRNIEPFIDLRAHYFEENHYAANLGLGGRWIVPTFGKVIGINCFYDFRHKIRSFHRLGVGLEFLGTHLDFRANGYFPMGHRSYVSRFNNYEYQGGYYAHHHRRHYALEGFDFEIGTSVKKWWHETFFDVYLTLGGYYYNGKSRNVHGGKIRLGAEYFDFILLEVRAAYDHIFKHSVQAVMVINLPIYRMMNSDYEIYYRDDPHRSFFRETARHPVPREEIIGFKRRHEWKTNF